MTGKHSAGWFVTLLAAAVALVGCSRSGSTAGGGSFDSAPPDIKATWEKAVAADKANDYVPAVQGYKQILAGQDKLSEAQAKTVQQASGKLYQRIVDASTKGDPAARAALSALTAGRDRAPVVPR